VFSISKLFERIISFVPRNDITFLQRVSKGFLNITKFGPVQEYLHHVPSNGRAGRETLQFRGEQITSRSSISTQLDPTRKSCIQGYGGEQFIERDEKAYKRDDEMVDRVLRNTQCAKPCLLEKDLSSCNLNPGPFKKLICALLAAAWDAKTRYSRPMQPDTFQITCDATLVQKIE
jgi:hypothetical protein